MQVERQTTGRSLGLEEALWLCRCLEDPVKITWVRYDMIWPLLTANRTVLDSNMAMFSYWQLHVSSVHVDHPYDNKLSRVQTWRHRHQSPSWGAAESMDRWTWIIWIVMTYRFLYILLIYLKKIIICFLHILILCTSVGFCWKCELGTDENTHARYRMTGAVVHEVWWTCIACINYTEFPVACWSRFLRIKQISLACAIRYQLGCDSLMASRPSFEAFSCGGICRTPRRVTGCYVAV